MEKILINPASKTGKYVLTGLLLLVLGIVVYVLYKTYIQFKDKEVQNYIKAEASRFSDPVAVERILEQGCKNILASRTLTNQVLASAAASGTTREFELVHAALMQAVSYGYLSAQ